MTAEAKKIVVGCGFDSTTQMGPLKSERRLKAIEDLVADAKLRGLSITTGGKRIDRPGFFYEPLLLPMRPLKRSCQTPSHLARSRH
jgi:succinate-semialdehyde dehydrogenase / glutarate-semialdehyde dehydrogenase